MTTITSKQLNELRSAAANVSVFIEKLAEHGFTIAPPDPPEAMVKLAREIACRVSDGAGYREYPAALAALQFADKVVVECFGGVLEADYVCDAIRRKLGAIA